MVVGFEEGGRRRKEGGDVVGVGEEKGGGGLGKGGEGESECFRWRRGAERVGHELEVSVGLGGARMGTTTLICWCN